MDRRQQIASHPFPQFPGFTCQIVNYSLQFIMPPVERIAVELYQTEDGRCPYLEWFDGLRDTVTRDRIDARLARLRLGNPGDHQELGDGLWELRLFFGPGLRIYFAWRGKRVVILLAGGKKGTQRQDIRRAREYLKDLREREP